MPLFFEISLYNSNFVSSFLCHLIPIWCNGTHIWVKVFKNGPSKICGRQPLKFFLILTRITDRKFPCLYVHVYQIIKNRGPGPYNSLRHADNRQYFSGRSLTWNRREPHMFYLAREVGKIWRCSCWEKGNFIMINEFKYCQTSKIWPSPLSLHFTVPLMIQWMLSTILKTSKKVYVEMFFDM